MVNERWFKYSDYFHRNAIMYWPLNIREQWGILTNRLLDESIEYLPPVDAECRAFEAIRAKIVKSKQENPSLDLKALGFGDPNIVETEDVGRFPDWDHIPMDSNGYTQSWYDEDGRLEGWYIDPTSPTYRQALKDEVERFAAATTGEKKSRPPKPVEGPTLALSPDMESRLIKTTEEPVEPVVAPDPVPDPVPAKVIRIDPNMCKQSKIPPAPKKPPRRGKGKHDKAVGTFDFGE